MIKKRIPVLIRWHKYIGLLIAPIVLLLVITGVLINHSDALRWSDKKVFSPIIARLYGIPLDKDDSGFVTEQHWFVQRGEQILMDATPVWRCTGELIGAVQLNSEIAVMCGANLAYLTEQAELIEILDVTQPDVGQTELVAMTLGHTPSGDLWLKAGNDDMFRLDPVAASWQKAKPKAAITWGNKTTLNRDLLAQVRSPVPGITQERVLLDLHSGRLFGWIGVIIVDAAAILLLYLAASGALTWWKRRPGTRRKL